MNFADKPEPTRYQGTAVAAEGSGTDGTTNVRGRSIDCDNRRTTVMKLPTDCVKFTEPTFARVSPVVAEMAHTDGTRVMQYQSDDQKSIKTTKMQMPMDFLEIPEPTLPRGFLDLAEEARNIKVESGRSCYTEEVPSQGTGLTRPVFVTVMEYSLDAAQVGTVPAGPVGPDIIIDRIQPVADGPVGQYSTRRPVGTDGMLSTSDSHQPTRFITHSPVGPDSILSTCDPDRPVADGPVGQSFRLGPVGPRRMFSLD